MLLIFIIRMEDTEKDIKKTRRETYERNIDYYIEYSKKNKEKKKEYMRMWYEKNKESVKEKTKEYRNNNKELVHDMNKKYHADNKDKLNENSREYYKKNKKQKNLYQKNRKNVDPNYKLKSNVRTLISNIIKGRNKGSRTIEIIGCSFDDFKKYIESKFEPWMTWDNYGKYNGTEKYGWDIDHIIPICSTINDEEVLKLNHYTNLQPLCSYTNRVLKRGKI